MVFPDAFGAERSLRGSQVLVVGSGHSAMDAVIGLARLKAEVPQTTALWTMRSAPTAKTFGGLTDDQLASRGALGERAKAAVDRGDIVIVAPFRVAAFSLTEGGVSVSGETAEGMRTITVDEVIVATGCRPDYSALSEIRLDLHPWLECRASSTADRSQRTQLRYRPASWGQENSTAGAGFHMSSA
jgi:lysine/ornithine N-monooxygenase